MTADHWRNKGRKGKSKFNKKDNFENANDIPLGPRISSQEARWSKFNNEGEGSGLLNQNDKKGSARGGGNRNVTSGGGKNRRKQDDFNEEFNPKSKKSQDEKKEINRLNGLLENGPHVEPSDIKSFKDLPLSKKTMLGLRDSEYEVPTEIQRESIGLALRGLDILGAAQTGSGKTLAFLIPVIEMLYRSLWSKVDGLGAVIITPTRELAYQIFEALRKIGRYHDFSAGLIIGGKDLKFERKRMDQMNIVICTPGRLLQHMDESSSFNTSNLQMLVLDEADRCLDMGFEREMNAILDHLPHERQTLLFSATQTKSVKDLARLSLKSPVYISVHENSQYSTPDALQQSYVVCPLESKLNMLWSFLKHHKKSKILVFMSSCKQVRFANMLFCRMRPGISILALHGAMHQLKRMSTYDEFCKKQAVALFATDIAARGLDFPAVDWVLQLDCPEDSTTYIHRAGRTARFNKGGEALLVLLPSEEEAMLSQLQQKRIPINKIEVNMKRMMSVTRKFEALLARDFTLKECAQRAFKAYLKSVFLMKNKDVFDVNALDLPSFARSLGLAVAPRVRFLQKRGVGQNQSGGNHPDSNQETESDAEEEEDDEGQKLNRVIEPTKSAVTFDFNTVDDDEDMDSLFTGKKPAQFDDDGGEDGDYSLELDQSKNPFSKEKSKKVKTKAQVAKKLLKKKIQMNKKVTFDEEGEAVLDSRKEKQSELARKYEMEDLPGINVEQAKLALKEEDHFDKQLHREKVKARHREQRRKAKLARKELTPEDMEDEEGHRLNTQEDDSEEEEYEPNLDWLPDPDKVFNRDENEESEGQEEDSAGESFDEEEDDDESWNRNSSKRPLREVVNTDSESESEEERSDEKLIKNRVIKNTTSLKKTKRPRVDGGGAGKNLDKDLMEDLALQLLMGKR